MQNRYVGDVGDYAKYGLLRALSGVIDEDGGPQLSLGVVWYLVPDEGHTGDGKHRGYLKSPEHFRPCDPHLFDAMYGMQTLPTVALVKNSEALPPGTVFFEDALDFNGVDPRRRRAVRDAWVREAAAATARNEIVFVDPDNGIADKAGRHDLKGPKFVFDDELKALRRPEQTLIVYHHLGRIGSHLEQVERKSARLAALFGSDIAVRAVWFRRGTARVFFILMASPHEALLQRRTERFEQSWARHLRRS